LKHVNGFTRAILCGFLALSLASASAGSHRLPSAAVQPWPVAVMTSAVDLASLVGVNRVAWPVSCSAVAFTLRDGEKTNVLKTLLGEDIEAFTVAGTRLTEALDELNTLKRSSNLLKKLLRKR